MNKKYKYINNNNETLFIELNLKYKDNNNKKPIFTASGALYDKTKIYTDKHLVSAGQCLHVIPEFIKSIDDKEQKKQLLTIHKLWVKHHLNDLKTWCKHQQYGEFKKDDVIIHHLTGNEEWKKLSKIRELPPEFLKVTEQGLKNIPKALYNYTSYDLKTNTHKEVKSNGWITYNPIYSPEGLIGKVCPVCGKKYGCSWYYKPISTRDLKTIKELMGE